MRHAMHTRHKEKTHLRVYGFKLLCPVWKGNDLGGAHKSEVLWAAYMHGRWWMMLKRGSYMCEQAEYFYFWMDDEQGFEKKWAL
jgi:hypothetical protein